MKTVTKDNFDFTLGAEYRKMTPLAKNHVRVALEEEIIVSLHSEGVETANTARPGDYIINTEGDGNGYIIQAHRFFEIYEDDPQNAGFYRSKITRIGLLTLEDVAFISPWGEEQQVLAGGVIIEAGPYIYGIDKHSFIEKYGRVDDSERRSCFALVSEALETQLEKAIALNLQNHILDIQTRLENRHLFNRS